MTKSFGIAVGLFAGMAISGLAEPVRNQPAENSAHGPVIQVQVEFIELPHETLTELLFLSEPANSNATELRKRVQELVGKKEAKTVETLIVSGRDREKAMTESVQEKIYTTEYEPSALPGTFSGPAIPAPPLDPSPKVATPTAFDTRNCGSTLEVEPVLSEDGRLIKLRLVPELVWHTGNTVWQDLKDSLGNLSNIQMPDFFTLRLNATVTCVNHQYLLATTLSPKNDKGEVDMSRKVMVFVKCDVLPAE